MTQAFFNFFKDEKFNDDILENFGLCANILFANDENLQGEFIDLLESKFIALALKKK